MNSILALTGNDIGGLFLIFIGLLILGCIVRFIMQKLKAPEAAYTCIWVFLGVVALVVVIQVFFGSGITVGSYRIHL